MGGCYTTEMARKVTFSQVQNLVNRAIATILDPPPNNIDEIWNYFEGRCAYCDRILDRTKREGHIDHLIPDNGNHLGNLVLACGPCNGDEKRDRPWKEFLNDKVKDEKLRKERYDKISHWVDEHPAPAPTPNTKEFEQETAELRAEVEQRMKNWRNRYNRLKKLRQESADTDANES
jgi:5-methylcytosine-specific restriction endonuclease McrA